MTARRRPMRRLGDLLPAMASALGLEEQLRVSRAMATWERLVAELVPAAAGSSRLLALEPPAVVVSASAPIVAQELRLRAGELLAALERAPGGVRALELRVIVRAAEPDALGRGNRPRSGPRVD